MAGPQYHTSTKNKDVQMTEDPLVKSFILSVSSNESQTPLNNSEPAKITTGGYVNPHQAAITNAVSLSQIQYKGPQRTKQQKQRE